MAAQRDRLLTHYKPFIVNTLHKIQKEKMLWEQLHHFLHQLFGAGQIVYSRFLSLVLETWLMRAGDRTIHYTCMT